MAPGGPIGSYRVLTPGTPDCSSRDCTRPCRPSTAATGHQRHRYPPAHRPRPGTAGPHAARHLADVAAGYAPIEVDPDSGNRGKRSSIVRDLLCELTGAESATVTNNNAAALMITLAALATDRHVIVSHGELIEIGGSFRLPDVIAAGGAGMRAVGTTNRTRIADYENAIDDWSAVLLKVHPSNYHVAGFAESVPLPELVALGTKHDLPVVHDIGSGLLFPAEQLGFPASEPDAQTSIGAGADLVLFSGDKLLGGPQAGIIVGRAELIDRIEKHPLMRAVRVDKLLLAALSVTLQTNRDPVAAGRSLPILQLARTSVESLRQRAGLLVKRWATCSSSVESINIVETEALYGGGTLPGRTLPSIAIDLTPSPPLTDDALARRLRLAEPGIWAQIHQGAVRIDLRTVFPDEDDTLGAIVEQVLSARNT
ncbi:MAG: L-seryl-tRNA(Sec) selenium transferase [Planctomycetes bacterium]|nr:L-seryl-tRNA(Sec) selenium transferase [Planctomycetota bacterium]